jgi:hypothetical protein
MYKSVVIPNSAFIGLKHPSRNKHTSEQKTWSMGLLQDLILLPFWQNPEMLDGLLRAKTAKAFARALASLKCLGGDLMYSHTLEYLQLWDSHAPCQIFGCSMSKATLATYIKPGKNSSIYVWWASCVMSGEVGVRNVITQLCRDVREQLPTKITFEDGSTASCPHFYVTDGSQNSCMLVHDPNVFDWCVGRDGTSTRHQREGG